MNVRGAEREIIGCKILLRGSAICNDCLIHIQCARFIWSLLAHKTRSRKKVLNYANLSRK